MLLPSDRFFVRLVPLAAGAAPAAQVTLALENLAPFPPGQLYHGWLPTSAGDQALVFAAYRRRFLPGETAAWEAAVAVVPGFLALLGEAPRVPLIRLLTEPRTVTALAWDGTHPLPVAVLARETEAPADAAQCAALVAEIRSRTGLAGATVQEFTGPVNVARPDSRGTVGLEVGDDARGLITRLGRGELEAADVRDKEFLTVQRTHQKRDLMLWRGFVAGLGGLAAMLVLEAVLFAGGIWRRNLQAAAQQQAPAIQRIETAQALSTRIEELSRRRLMPFEMLALLNQNRPASVQFVRTATTGLYALEIEAQTTNAADVGQYEAVLRAAPELAGVETRDLRSRDGLTTFTLAVTFKPESLQKGEGP